MKPFPTHNKIVKGEATTFCATSEPSIIHGDWEELLRVVLANKEVQPWPFLPSLAYILLGLLRYGKCQFYRF